MSKRWRGKSGLRKWKGKYRRDGRKADVYRKYLKHRYSRRRKLVNEFKKQPCADCGVRYPPYVMDFDHVAGEKKFNIASAVYSGGKLQVLIAEIMKCDLVCSNCHRERTHGKRTAKRV